MNAILDNEVKYIIACSINQEGVQIFILWNAKHSLPKQAKKKPKEKHALWTGHVIITCFHGFFQLPFQHQIIISVIHVDRCIAWMEIF